MTNVWKTLPTADHLMIVLVTPGILPSAIVNTYNAWCMTLLQCSWSNKRINYRYHYSCAAVVNKCVINQFITCEPIGRMWSSETEIVGEIMFPLLAHSYLSLHTSQAEWHVTGSRKRPGPRLSRPGWQVMEGAAFCKSVCNNHRNSMSLIVVNSLYNRFLVSIDVAGSNYDSPKVAN